MPELPEVETIVRGLRGAIVGERIMAVDIRLAKIAQAPPGVDFARALLGETITGVTRRAKYALIELASGRRLVTSLRMTGRLVVGKPGDAAFPGTHIVFALKSLKTLSFADIRTFGRMRLVEPGDAWDANLGPEPLEKAFTPEAFVSMLSERTTSIKVLLLDQRRIAGIGNIYACEALWEAKIRPSTPAKDLSRAAMIRLHGTLIEVLSRAVEMRGSSIDDYVDADGLRGGFQNVLAVYGRLGQPCTRCGTPIQRSVLAGRGTWWCRMCQPRSRKKIRK